MLKVEFRIIENDDEEKATISTVIEMGDGLTFRGEHNLRKVFNLAQRADRDKFMIAPYDLGSVANFTLKETTKVIGGSKVMFVNNTPVSGSVNLTGSHKKWSSGYRYLFNSVILRNNERRVILPDGGLSFAVYQSSCWGPPLLQLSGDKTEVVAGGYLGKGRGFGLPIYDREWFGKDGLWKNSEFAYLGIEVLDGVLNLPSSTGIGGANLKTP